MASDELPHDLKDMMVAHGVTSAVVKTVDHPDGITVTIAADGTLRTSVG